MTSIVVKKIISKNPQVISKWACHNAPDFWTRRNNPAIEKSRSSKAQTPLKTPTQQHEISRRFIIETKKIRIKINPWSKLIPNLKPLARNDFHSRKKNHFEKPPSHFEMSPSERSRFLNRREAIRRLRNPEVAKFKHHWKLLLYNMRFLVALFPKR